MSTGEPPIMRIRGIKDGKTMGKKALVRALIAPLALFAAGCGENVLDDLYRPAGAEIVFSAAGGYANGVGTEYSGDARSVTGYTSPFERIDWSDGDMITVSYTRGSSRSSADFRVGVPERSWEPKTTWTSRSSRCRRRSATSPLPLYIMTAPGRVLT